MKITKKFLEDKSACSDGMEWVEKNGLIGLEAVPFLNKLIENNKLDWANWLIVRVMKRKQNLAYAIFAAEQVIDIFEKAYPNDKGPREAIEAAKRVLENDTKENREVADAAADAAYAAFGAAFGAADAAYAVYAVYAAANAANAAANATNAVANAANTTYAVANAANATNAEKEVQLKILNYGLSLLTK